MPRSPMDQIRHIARQTRRWALRHRHKVWADATLCGMCAIASAELHKRLTAAGFSAAIAFRNTADEGHAFVICDELIVDVTATQFGWITRRGADLRYTRERRCRAVEIVPLSDKASRPLFWQETAIYDSLDALVLRQKQSGWPPDQIAWKQLPRTRRTDRVVRT